MILISEFVEMKFSLISLQLICFSTAGSRTQPNPSRSKNMMASFPISGSSSVAQVFRQKFESQAQYQPSGQLTGLFPPRERNVRLEVSFFANIVRYIVPVYAISSPGMGFFSLTPTQLQFMLAIKA